MKTILTIGVLTASFATAAFSQGEIFFWNATARTHMGTLEGPLAGPGIWAQLLVGTNVDLLNPVGMPLEHRLGGRVGGPSDPNSVFAVPGIPCNSWAYVQMVAWDGTRWGTDLAAVPLDQLGRTDVIGHFLTCYPATIYAPWFMQSAVVPVPEPSGVGLGLLGGALLLARRRAKRVR